MNKSNCNVVKQRIVYHSKKIGFISFIILFFFSACSVKKRVYRSGYYISWYGLANDKSKKTDKQFLNYSWNAYDALSIKPTQETIINVDDASRIFCTEGTIIDIPENAFEYDNGVNLKCTKVNVYVWEYYLLADIIAAGLTTTSNRKMLFSDGMVYIEARCLGERLKLKSDKQIVVQMPSAKPDSKMQLFAGNFKNGIIDWKVKGNPEIKGLAVQESTELVENEDVVYSESEYASGYLMKLSSLGWINCDRFYEIEKKTNLIVKVPSVKNTFVALVFKEMKSIMPGYCFSNNTIDFNNLPDAQQVTLVAYSIDAKNKTTKACTYDLLLGETKEIEIKMNEISQDELKSLLASFN